LNYGAVAAIGSLLTFFATVMGVAYLAGKFTQRIDDGDVRNDKQDTRLDKHDEKLEEHGNKIVRLQEWKNGFNAAANVSGGREVE
jgi:hypothetical protein